MSSTVATDRAATAEQITTLQTSVAGNTSSIQTQATSINGLNAQYTVKVDAGGQVAGFGLASEPSAAGPNTSNFVVLADKFAVGAPGKTAQYPFIIDTATNKVAINGELVVTGSISGNALATNSVDADKLAANSVTADKIAVNSLSAISANLGYVTAGEVHGGKFHSGGFSGAYAWPPSGQNGFHLSPIGLLMGNGNDGHWVQIDADGRHFSMPGLRMQNGTLYIDQLNVIGAHNIRTAELTKALVLGADNLNSVSGSMYLEKPSLVEVRYNSTDYKGMVSNNGDSSSWNRVIHETETYRHNSVTGNGTYDYSYMCTSTKLVPSGNTTI